ncbi:MAG: sodium/solute symporter [Halioglobus sp.]
MGELPSPGVAGAFVGTHNGALIIAGGANFPTAGETSVWDEGVSKVWYSQIHVALRAGDAGESLRWISTDLALPRPLGYGASASHSLGVLLMGGNDSDQAHADVYLLRWDSSQQQPTLLTLPSLPTSSANGDAAVIGDTVYLMPGSVGDSESADLYSLDLSQVQTDNEGNPLSEDGQVLFGTAASQWRQLSPIPSAGDQNPGRSHMMLASQNDGRGERLYVIGGRRKTTLAEHPDAVPVGLREGRFYLHFFSDVWAFNPNAGADTAAWSRKADIQVDGQTSGQSAGSAVAVGQSHILLLSGSNGSQLRSAFGEQGVSWKDYPNHPGFRRQILAYNTITDAWTNYGEAPLIDDPAGEQIGQLSANAVTTTAVNWDGQIILPSGEVRPRVRSPLIWAVDLEGSVAHFGWQNMTVLVIYLLCMVLIGVRFASRNKNTDDYFRGGQNIPWWAAACSMYATMLSSLTYIALPALVYRTDWLLYIGTMMILVVAPIAIYVAMPFFRQIDATSAYEYLSRRFNMPVRLFASALFALFHIGRMGIVMALTALALAAVTPLDAWHCVLIMGVLCLIYCTLGGVEAVIWTDTIQTVVLLLGALLCFAYIINGIDGGFSGFIESGMAANKFRTVNLDFELDSITTLSIWVIVLGGIGQNLSSYTADQAVVQRYMVTRDTRAAAHSIWANGIVAVPGALLFFCIGTGLYAFYRSQPEKLDPTMQIDQVFPAFIATELPVGIAGLIVAGIFAAAQSTVSTSMNSLATTLVTDFMRPFNMLKAEADYLNAARLLTFIVGALGTLAGLLFISPDIRSLMEEYFKVIGMFMGALGGLFVLGVTTSKANGWGALVGIFAGVGVMLSAWLGQWADGYLFATIGIVTCLAVGYCASLVIPSGDKDLDGLTLYTLHRNQPTQATGVSGQ